MFGSWSWKKNLLISLSPLALSVWTAPLMAQEGLGGITEIVVTAQKREQSLQDVGIAISVLTSEALAAKGVTTVAEVGASIPNIQVNYATDIVSFNIRGIGQSEFASNFDPPVAVNVDEVYLSKVFMTGLLLFDIERFLIGGSFI